MTGNVTVRKHTRRRTGRSADIARRLGLPEDMTVGEYQRRRANGLRRVDRPGKFEGELLVSEMLWEASMDWGFDEEIGSVQDFGFYGLIVFDKDITKDLEGAVRMQKLTDAERAFLREQAGAILSEDNSGFVGVRYYEDKGKLMRAWGILEADSERFYEGEGE